MAGVASGHSVFNQASDHFTVNTGYSRVDGTETSVKDRFRMGRTDTPDLRFARPSARKQSLAAKGEMLRLAQERNARMD